MSATMFTSTRTTPTKPINENRCGTDVPALPVTFQRQESSRTSRIPVPSPQPLRRSHSLRLTGERTDLRGLACLEANSKYQFYSSNAETARDQVDNALQSSVYKNTSQPWQPPATQQQRHQYPPSTYDHYSSLLHSMKSYNSTAARSTNNTSTPRNIKHVKINNNATTYRQLPTPTPPTSPVTLTAPRLPQQHILRRGHSFHTTNESAKSAQNCTRKPTTTNRASDNGYVGAPHVQLQLVSTGDNMSNGGEGHSSADRERRRSLSLPNSNGPSSRVRSPRSPGTVSSPSDYQRHLRHTPNGGGHGSGGGTGGAGSTARTSIADCWDTESITSGISGISLASTTGAPCDHASVARNGTTFSGRSMKYVFHCNQHSGQTGDDYLTPTQRAHRQVRKLKLLLRAAQANLEQKDSDIVKLTREVVELRLYKAALGSPDDKSNSSDVDDVVTVRENEDAEGYEGLNNAIATLLVNGDVTSDGPGQSSQYNEMNSSYTDSGHYDDYTCSSVHSKDSMLLVDDFHSPRKQRKHVELVDRSTSADYSPITELELAHKELVAEYERRLKELSKEHNEDQQSLKQQHSTKVDELLQRISEINTRYWELVPELDSARERIKELEEQLDEAMKKLEEQEEKNKKTFLEMYHQGEEAAKFQQEAKIMEIAHRTPSRISVSELLHQLQVTQHELENIKDVEYAASSSHKQPLLSAKEAVSLWVLGARKAMYRQLTEAKSKNKIDPEITLQFLKSAIYYFLTDKENDQGHLRAIQSILGFSPAEISNIEKARTT